MERKAFTLRMSTKLYSALSTLSSVGRRSMNELISEAVSLYVVKESRAAERDLEYTLERLRQYTNRDPKFEQAIEAIADAESQCPDPLEGTPYPTVSAAQSEIRELLRNA